MIHSVWIVKDGINFCNINCNCIDIENNLITGLFSAITAFVEPEISRNLNTIQIGEFKFFFLKKLKIYIL